MNLPEDNDKNSISPQLAAAMAVTAFFILLIIVIVLVANRKPRRIHIQQPAGDAQIQTQTSNVILEDEPEPSEVKPGDLDFWDMYPKNDGEATDAEQETDKDKDKDKEKESEAPEDDDGLPPEAKDGKHTLVTLRNGKEEWVTITPYLPKNDIDVSNLVLQSDKMAYYEDGKRISYLGMCIDKYDDYIDFNKIKNDGIDFVMLRVGVRGYGTGTVTLDEYFADNLSRANQAGLDIGLYFTSQAITLEEAIEEANILKTGMTDYKIAYPLAIDIGFVKNDTSRIEELTRTEKTEILRAFADEIKNAGFNCVIRADKEFLIKEIDLSKFSDVDIWLVNRGDLPDYPYAFTMWEYTGNATIDGVKGYTDLTISFIDYTQK